MFGSGMRSMSDSWTRLKPSIAEPSKVMPSSRAVSSSAGVDGEALELAEDVGEPQADEADAAFLDGSEHVVVLVLHRASLTGRGEGLRRPGTPRHAPFTLRSHPGNNRETASDEAAPNITRPACPPPVSRPVGSAGSNGGDGEEIVESRTPQDVLKLAKDSGASSSTSASVTCPASCSTSRCRSTNSPRTASTRATGSTARRSAGSRRSRSPTCS